MSRQVSRKAEQEKKKAQDFIDNLYKEALKSDNTSSVQDSQNFWSR